MKMTKKDLKAYRSLARAIHKLTCQDRGWCNYGKKPPKEMRDDPSLPWIEQQERAKARLHWYRSCQAAVDAENLAARARPRRRV